MKHLPTHVEGLDTFLGGGLPEGSLTLVTGPPGTMKSSLCYALLHGNALAGVPGLYVSLEQSRGSLEGQMRGLGLPPEATAGRLTVLDLSLLRERMGAQPPAAWMDFFRMYTQSFQEGLKYRLLVLDSLDALEILARFQDHRRAFFRLARWLRDLQVTCLLIGELPRGRSEEALSRHGEEFLVDGILHLDVVPQGEFSVQRRIRAVKMRGARHALDVQTLVFDGRLRVMRPLS